MTGKNVLVVDDEKVICELVARLLANAGFHTFCGNSMAEALELLARERVDIVLTDIRMPGGSGLDLLDRIRADKRGVPVVLMTAFADVSREQAIVRGAVELVPKPFEPETLVSLLQRILA